MSYFECCKLRWWVNSYSLKNLYFYQFIFLEKLEKSFDKIIKIYMISKLVFARHIHLCENYKINHNI